MVQIHSRLPLTRRYLNHGEAKRRFHIIDCNGHWKVKKRLVFNFWFYIREKDFKKLQFNRFRDVVEYVNKRRK